ncbi:MAG: hypothetical protein H6702_24475 [Myxococcales bacterium]|nr:hypothetical protein [Myxococcales bacterium]
MPGFNSRWAVFVLLALCSAARADPCADVVAARLAHTADPLLLLMDLDRMHAQADAVDAVADRTYLSAADAWRVSGALAMGTRFILGRDRCSTAERAGEAGASLAHMGLRARVAHRPTGLLLGVFGTGRMDTVLVRETGPGEGQETVGRLRGLLGVELEITRWVRLAWAGLGSEPWTADDPYWRRAIAPPSDASPRHLIELGVPALGLRLQLTDAGDELGPRELSVRDLPLGWLGLRLDLLGRVLPVEPGWQVAARLVHRRATTADSHLDLGLGAAFGTDDGALRAVRATFAQTLLEAGVTRTSYSRIGAHVTHAAELTLHRGPAVRAAAAADAAVGAWWRAQVGLQSPYLHFGFEFGLGINRPELLDLLPAAANRAALQVGLTLAQRW